MVIIVLFQYSQCKSISKRLKHMYSTCILFIAGSLGKSHTERCRSMQTRWPLPPNYTEVEIAEGKTMKYPMCWTNWAIEVLHEGVKAYMVTLLEDVLAIHPWRVTLQPWDIQLACRIRRTGTGTSQTNCVVTMSQSHMLNSFVMIMCVNKTM